MATKGKKKAKKTAAKKAAPRKKLDGKALAAKRKPRDSVAQFIKDELTAGKSDVDAIIEKAKKEFPKSDPTRGYVRYIAKQIGKSKQVAPEEKPKEKKASKKKAAAKKSDSAPAAKTDADPAS
jgi:hypothetical protein